MRKNSEKVGFVAKNSDRATPPRATSTEQEPRRHRGPGPQLLSASHYHHRPHCHPTPRLFEDGIQCFELMTGGRGWVEVDGQWRELHPGDLCWHVPGDYTIGRSDFADPYRCLAVRFHGGGVWTRRVPRITRWKDLDEVRGFTREVVRLHADHAFDSGVLLHYVAGRLQFQAELSVREQSRRSLPEEVGRALGLLEKRYAEPLRLKDLAREAGWSIPHLHDMFKETLGLSPHQALIRRRLQAARELLASTNEPVKSVAARCGFTAAAAFCAQFRKSTGLSPTEYRSRQHYGGTGG